jgi:hypothetical protein
MSSNGTPPYSKLHRVFLNLGIDELETQELGQLLNILSLELGSVAAELIDRGVPSEVIDKHINRSLLRGVDAHKWADPESCAFIAAVEGGRAVA